MFFSCTIYHVSSHSWCMSNPGLDWETDFMSSETKMGLWQMCIKQASVRLSLIVTPTYTINGEKMHRTSYWTKNFDRPVNYRVCRRSRDVEYLYGRSQCWACWLLASLKSRVLSRRRRSSHQKSSGVFRVTTSVRISVRRNIFRSSANLFIVSARAVVTKDWCDEKHERVKVGGLQLAARD